MPGTTPKLYTALIKAKQAFGSLKVNADNPYFNSKYLDLQGVQEATDKPLHDNGLVVLQTTDITDTGHPVLVTTLAHESGETASGRYPLSPKEANNPQSLGGCVTYARRYALMGILGIAPEDDDGNAASGKNASPATQRPSTPQRPTSTPAATPAREVNTQTGELTNDPLCPDCGGQMWDNRAKKASGEYAANRPDFSCKKRAGNPDCKGAIWPPKDQADGRQREDDAARSLSTEEEVNQYFGGASNEPPYQDSDR